MTVVYEPKEIVFADHPDWDRRSVKAHTPFTRNDREYKCQEFTIEKSEWGVEIEFETNEGSFSRYFIHDEFNEFIKQCQWVAECQVAERKVEDK
jgi:hypothetical protein